ncbi:MAG: threonylcarbamoyl-AMP synthase [Planctomycetes bacterium]|nr:threonylcarbamoyl-AMP synthase [Planctomycetota bacterium]
MATVVAHVDPRGEFREAVRQAAEILTSGGLVAFPTETVYGLAARADVSAAMHRLRQVKGRAAEKAFTVHLGARADAARFAPEINAVARRLIRKAWPGPLTVILPVPDPGRAPIMSQVDPSACEAMYYDHMIGLRCPDDPVAEALLRAVPAPVVAASANLAGNPPPQSGEEVLRDLDGKIDFLIDAGRTKYSRPSTIVRMKDQTYEVVRPGVYDAGSVERLATLRILLVCTGNTCRSPMAAGLAGKLAADKLGCDMSSLPARGVLVSSAGTAGGLGRAAPHAVTVLARRGIDISGHTSTALTAEQVRLADHVFVMTDAHRDAVIDLVPQVADRVQLLLPDQEVGDPVGGTEEDYEACAQLIERGVRARLEEVLG